MSIKLRYLIFYISMALGAVFVGIYILHDFLSGAQNTDLPWALALAAFFFIGGIVFRVAAVRCPFCGIRLRDPGMGPETCPTCGKSAFERPQYIEEEVTEETEAEQAQ